MNAAAELSVMARDLLATRAAHRAAALKLVTTAQVRIDVSRPIQSAEVRRASYAKLLASHDWFFEYSDDHSAYLHGRASLDALKGLQPEVDVDWALWNLCAPDSHKRTVFTFKVRTAMGVAEVSGHGFGTAESVLHAVAGVVDVRDERALGAERRPPCGQDWHRVPGHAQPWPLDALRAG